MLDAAAFRDIALSNPANRRLLAGLGELGLPQCFPPYIRHPGEGRDPAFNAFRRPKRDPGLRRGDGRRGGSGAG